MIKKIYLDLLALRGFASRDRISLSIGTHREGRSGRKATMLRRSARLVLFSPPFLPRATRTLNPIRNPNSVLSFSSSSSSYISDAEFRKYAGYFVLLLGCGVATYYSFPFPENAKHKKAQLFRYAPLPEDLHTVSNWSGTHEVHTRVFHQPETLADLENVVRDAHEKRHRIRPVGSGLSPNGIGLAKSGMVNLALMDKVLEVDQKAKRVRVQAGIRVSQLVDALKEHGLTLQNFASIREQQIGGIIQVGPIFASFYFYERKIENIFSRIGASLCT